IDAELGVALGEGSRGPPASELEDHRLEGLPALGQLVDPGSGRRRELAAAEQIRLLELAQALGEDIGAHVRQAGPEVAETLGAEQELAHHEQRPALADEVESPGYAAGVAVRTHHIRSLANSPEGRSSSLFLQLF